MRARYFGKTIMKRNVLGIPLSGFIAAVLLCVAGIAMVAFLMLLPVVAFEDSSPAHAEYTPEHTLTYFSYALHGDMMPRCWEVALREDGYYIQENDEEPRSFPEALAYELTRAIHENSADRWQGVYETEFEVLDGEGFSLEMEFADGASVQASGENAFPDGYFSFQRAVLDIFKQDKMACLAGTYLYEGDGIGGDFTITLNVDGTYTFYEGALSSYIGAGTWDIYFDVVYLTEGESGFDLSFMLGVDKDVLIYLADGSDAFVYIKVPDQGRFIKQVTGSD